jgi:hypothetical protein
LALPFLEHEDNEMMPPDEWSQNRLKNNNRDAAL